jgi:hypothetical protein
MIEKGLFQRKAPFLVKNYGFTPSILRSTPSLILSNSVTLAITIGAQSLPICWTNYFLKTET